MTCDIPCFEDTYPGAWNEGVDFNALKPNLYFTDVDGNQATDLVQNQTYTLWIPLNNNSMWWQNFRLNLYLDGVTECVFCTKSHMGAWNHWDYAIDILMNGPIGTHTYTVENVEKATQRSITFSITSGGSGTYEWFTVSPQRTASYFTWKLGTNDVGACCIGTTCSQTTQDNCTGTFKGVGIPCSPTNPCASTVGACCIGTTCSQTTQANCTGTFKGVGISCYPDPCSSSNCKDRTKSQCTSPCHWYAKYFWEEEKCYDKEQNYFEDYKPFIIAGAIVGGAAVLALMLKGPRQPRYY